MADDQQDIPLNAIRAFVSIARERNVTRAAKSLGMTQSSASRYLAVLEEYLGAELIERRGRAIELTDVGRLFASTVTEPLDTICFTAQRMRRKPQGEINRIVVRTSLTTLAYTFLVPHIQAFSREYGGAVVDIVNSLSPPRPGDGYDVLITRDLSVIEPADQWELYSEQLVCVGSSTLIESKGASIFRTIPMLTITSRPDILPTWLRAMDLTPDDIRSGARYDHHYLALPAITNGNCLLVAPEIIVSQLIRDGLVKVVPGTCFPSGMHYRVYAVDQGGSSELARLFCRWLVRLFRENEKSRA